MKRRDFLKVGGTLLVACAGAGLGPLLMRNRRVYGKSTCVMGTVAEIQVVHDDARFAMSAIDQAFDEVIRIERSMSYFRPDSEISRINRSACRSRLSISRETAAVIQRGLHWSNVTRGEFDPGLGRIVGLWNVKENTEPPSPQLVEAFKNRGLYRHIVVDVGSASGGIQLSSEDVLLDLGGIAKGYAADQAASVLARLGIDQALVNLGGDLACLGGRSESQGWKVGIKDPIDTNRIARVLTLRNQSVATSGNYVQYFSYGGRVYHHLIDPRSAQPGPGGFRSMTIVADNCRDADALATGLFFAEDAEIRRTLEDNTPGAEFIRLGT